MRIPIILIYLEKSLKWISFHIVYFYNMRSGHFDKCYSAGSSGAWEKVRERKRRSQRQRHREKAIETETVRERDWGETVCVSMSLSFAHVPVTPCVFLCLSVV